MFPVVECLSNCILLMLCRSAVFFPLLEGLRSRPTISSLEGIHYYHRALLFKVFLKSLVFSWLISDFFSEITSLVFELNHLLSQVVSLLYHHLLHFDIALVFPINESTFLLPSIHICEDYVPVCFCLLEFVLICTPGIEYFTKISSLVSLDKVIYAYFIFDSSLLVEYTLLVKIECLSQEFFSCLLDNQIWFVFWCILVIFTFPPSVHSLFEISSMANLNSSCCRSSSRSDYLVLLLFYFNIQRINLSLHLSAFFFHDHVSHFLKLDCLLGSTFFPHVKSLTLPLMESSDNHSLEILVYSRSLCLVHLLPVLEVARKISFDVLTRSLKPSTFAWFDSLLCLSLYLLVHLFNGWLAVPLKCCLHQKEFFLFLILTKDIEASLQQPWIASLFEIEHSHVLVHHIFAVSVVLSPSFDIGP